MREITIITPVYNDWAAFILLVEETEKVAKENAFRVNIIAVNDGSVYVPKIRDDLGELLHVVSIRLMHLSRNLGHQRSIAVGLSALNKMHKEADTPIIVMDCDGEDKPSDIPRLLAEHDRHSNSIIFAQRARRSEGFFFTLFYKIFKLFFRILTGSTISFGNFCLIPPGALEKIVYYQEVWNHFAAGIMHSNLKWKTISTNRGLRYAGKSHMNLVSLVLHGLSAISVYTETVYVRLILTSFLVIILDIIGFIILLYVKYLTPLAIPGWATNVAVGLVLIMLQAILFLTILSFAVLGYRSMKMFIPAIDFENYLRKTEIIV
ncbi:MAG: glycosyltransferase [Anaerolineae bacterium]|jgi:polyisoprenyl-phosphate glycosyltransferase|nr:glycosyltransferase [Anaerolineae bacterium]MBT7191007.1 glycosyltransferase [Anaerolineae bacterium]MBT7989468.1 glycosyltransferase [Anaerolineae bacterium]